MLLKTKLINWSAGGSVVMLNDSLAKSVGVNIDGRVLLSKGSKKAIAMVDIADGFVKKTEVILSTEAAKALSVKNGDMVKVELTTHQESIELIHKKLSCTPLSYDELKKVMSDITSNVLVGSEIAYFVSAIYKCGMSLRETVDLTRAMVDTGVKLNLKNKLIVDKHSIGGISGRITPIVVSICSSAGITMPKTSSRAITSPSGTADCMEVLCNVSFSPSQLRSIVHKTNACIVWGGTLGFAPADDKLINIEKMLHLDPEPQLLASIISKKLSVGAKYAIIDIPYGLSAKVKDKKGALKLKKKFEVVGKNVGIKIKCFLFHESEPRGNGVGPLLEAREVIEVLSGQSDGYHLRRLAIEMAGDIFELIGKCSKGRGKVLAEKILSSGKAYEKFKEIVAAQGGEVKKFSSLTPGKFSKDIIAKNNFVIKAMDIKRINQLAIIAGCPSRKASGLYLHKHLGNKVRKGEKILTIYSQSKAELDEAVKFYSHIEPVR